MIRIKSTIAVSFLLISLSWASVSTAAMVGNLEAPAGVGSQISNVQGWVFTTTPGAELLQPFDVLLDGVKVMEVPCCSSRGDVQDEHPEAPLQTGFSGVLNWAREALAADGPVTVSVVVRDTAGGELVLEQEVDLYALASFPFIRRAYFDEESRRVAGCRLENVPGSDEEPIAQLSCTQIGAVSGDRSMEETCPGEVRFTWDRGTQGFKQSSFCEPIPRWTDNGDGTATDNLTGLMWELKTGEPDPDTLIECGLLPVAPECADRHHVNNAYQWSESGSQPTGSAFAHHLTLLNRAVSDDGLTSEGCFGGYCDWRMPTADELLVATALCESEPCEDSIPGPSAIAHWTRSSSEDPTQAIGLALVIFPGDVDKTDYLPVRAVRGEALPEHFIP